MWNRTVVSVAIVALLAFVACDSTTGPVVQSGADTADRNSARLPQEFAEDMIAFGGEWAPPDDGGGGGGPGAAPLVEILTPANGEQLYCGQQHKLRWRVADMPGMFRATAEVWFENGVTYYEKLCDKDVAASSLWWVVPNLTCQEASVRVTVEFLRYRPNRDVIAFGGERSPPDDGGGGSGARGSWQVYLTQVAEIDFGPIVQRRAHRLPNERD